MDKIELWLPPSFQRGKTPYRVKQAFQMMYKRTGLPDKTLWDILQLLGVLAIPVVVVIAANLFSVQQHQTDIQIANDQQQETILQTYLDNMSGLLLNNKLLQSQPDDAVREVARIQTLTALRRLDSARKSIILHFLYEANLIGSYKPYTNLLIPAVFSLSGADLSKADLTGADLTGVNLSSAHLSGAILTSGDLTGAHLSGAHLSGANLSGAHLSGADLSGADLSGADLTGARLSSEFLIVTNLSGTDQVSTNLSGADLSGADLSGANLTGAKLSGAIMPNGSKHQ